MQNRQRTFFDLEKHQERHERLKDPLVKLQTAVDWAGIAVWLDKYLPRQPNPKGGRPPYPHELMIKILFVQRLNGLSFERMEFLLVDSLSIHRFMNLIPGDDFPDQNTIWLYLEQIVKANLSKKLFRRVLRSLKAGGLKLGRKGSIVDATFVEVPRQRNSRKENQMIKNGIVPPEWNKPKYESKLAQKDLDARWTKKNEQTFFGYKDHTKVDVRTKIITEYHTTSAEVHDSQVAKNLMSDSDKGKPMYGDSAYKSATLDRVLNRRGIINKIHEKGYRNKPLTESQIARNTAKSRIRARIEHVYGYFHNNMRADYARSIGLQRVATIIGLNNLVYNIVRAVSLNVKIAM